MQPTCCVQDTLLKNEMVKDSYLGRNLSFCTMSEHPIIIENAERSAPMERALCRNCGSELGGTFCSACGQDASETVVPLKTFVKQGVEDVIAFDFRYPRTLRALFNPGQLTADYLWGKRVRYVPPLKLAFNASVLLFIVVALTAPESAKVTLNSEISQDLGYFAREYALMLTVGQLFVLPIWASIVRLGFKKQKPLYLNHLIFTLHFHAAVAITLVVIALLLYVLPLVIAGWLVSLLVMWIYGPFLILSIRRVYQSSWQKTIGLGLLAMVSYIALLIVVSGLLIGLGLLVLES